MYNRYVRVEPDQPHEDATMILRPLFSTGWLIAEHLKDADRVIVSSASSKTAYSTAFVLAEKGIPTTGLTSPRNRGYATSLDLYDEVITYDEVATGLSGPGVYVDFAGNLDISRAVHERAELTESIQVGLTHWDRERPSAGLPDPQPEFFFAPAHIERLSKEFGPRELQERIGVSRGASPNGWTDSWRSRPTTASRVSSAHSWTGAPTRARATSCASRRRAPSP